jgi:hypothetical protein
MLVFGQRYDYSWYGPIGHDGTARGAQRVAQRIAGTAIGRRQRSGAILYVGAGDDAERVAVVIPAELRPGGHSCMVEEWLDTD